MRKMLFILLIFLSGCSTIDPSLQLDKNTKVEIMDVTTNWYVSTAVASDNSQFRQIVRRIMENTKNELSKRSIESFTDYTPDAAKVKYDIRTINSSYRVIGSAYGVIGRDKYEVKYKVTLESPDGKKLWEDTDEKDDSDLDDVLEKIASRVARNVSKYFKQNN